MGPGREAGAREICRFLLENHIEGLWIDFIYHPLPKRMLRSGSWYCLSNLEYAPRGSRELFRFLSPHDKYRLVVTSGLEPESLPLDGDNLFAEFLTRLLSICQPYWIE